MTPALPVLLVLPASRVRSADDFFRCSTLGACLFASACLARQDRGGATLTRDSKTSRASVAYFPSCSEKCLEGAMVRKRLHWKPKMRWIRRWGFGSFIRVPKRSKAPRIATRRAMRL